VVENHLAIEMVASRCFFAELDQAPRVEQGIGVPLEAAGVPRQVDKKPAQDLFRVCACGLRRDLGAADFS
jgi:hypothetical protein